MSAEFLLTALIVVAVPGTGVVYTLSSAVADGRRAGLVAAAGCTLGIVPHLVLATLLLSGLVTAGEGALQAVRWAGVAYLAYLAVDMLRASDVPLGAADPDMPFTAASARVWRAVLINLLNPKLVLFFVAFLPQFIPSDPAPLDPRVLGLSGAFMAMTFVVFAGYAVLADLLRAKVFSSARARRWLVRELGGALLVFAGRLATDS